VFLCSFFVDVTPPSFSFFLTIDRTPQMRWKVIGLGYEYRADHFL